MSDTIAVSAQERSLMLAALSKEYSHKSAEWYKATKDPSGYEEGAADAFKEEYKAIGSLLERLRDASPTPTLDVRNEGDRDLVRELDVLLNGYLGAAEQASLCDIVAQVRAQGIRVLSKNTKPFAYVRAWNGDESDEGKYLFVAHEDEKDDTLGWSALYLEQQSCVVQSTERVNDELELIQSVLSGYAHSIAQMDALRAVTLIRKLINEPTGNKSKAVNTTEIVHNDLRFNCLLTYVNNMAKAEDNVRLYDARRAAQLTLANCASYEREIEHKAGH